MKSGEPDQPPGYDQLMRMALNKNWMLLAFVTFCTTVSAYFTPGISQTGAFLLLPLAFLAVRKSSNLRIDWSVALLLAACLVVACLHYSDSKSLLNLALMVSTIFTLALAARHVIARDANFVHTLCRVCEVVLCFAAVMGIAGTALHLPISPTYYPWDAITGDVRMFIMGEDDLGHTSSIWLATFAIIGRLTSQKPLRWRNLLIVGLLLVPLIFSKSRISLIMLGFVSFGLVMCATNLRPKRVATVMLASAWLYFTAYFVVQLNLDVRRAVEDQVLALQDEFPELRIAASGSSVLFAGRDALNERLMALIAEAPWIGVGQSDPILNVTYSTTPMAYVEGSSESPLRLPAKYGIPFTLVLLALLLRATWAARASAPMALIMTCIIVTAASEATFEVLQAFGGLFFFFAVLCIEHMGQERKAQRRARELRQQAEYDRLADRLRYPSATLA